MMIEPLACSNQPIACGMIRSKGTPQFMKPEEVAKIIPPTVVQEEPVQQPQSEEANPN